MSDLLVLILAAGKGTRMKSRKAKVLHQVGGASLVEHVVATARSVSSSVSVVIGHQAETVRALMPEVSFVEQKEQLGTGHAVMVAREQLSAHKGDLLVLPGDVPLISSETLKAFIAFHTQGGYAASVMTADVDDPHGYGRIVRRGDNELKSIVEHRDATPEILKISEINSSIYVFNTPALFEALTQVRNENSQSEYYLTDVIGILGAQGRKVGAFKSPRADEILGINTRKELAAIDRIMRRRKCESLMADGVTIIDPDSTFIDAEVQIGADTVIHPSVQIHGKTIIGEDVDDSFLQPNRQLTDRSPFDGAGRLRCGRRDVGRGCFCRTVRPPEDEYETRRWSQSREFRRDQEIHAGQRNKIHAFDLSGRRDDRQEVQHRRRHHHLQLRRPSQASHGH